MTSWLSCNMRWGVDEACVHATSTCVALVWIALQHNTAYALHVINRKLFQQLEYMTCHPQTIVSWCGLMAALGHATMHMLHWVALNCNVYVVSTSSRFVALAHHMANMHMSTWKQLNCTACTVCSRYTTILHIQVALIHPVLYRMHLIWQHIISWPPCILMPSLQLCDIGETVHCFDVQCVHVEELPLNPSSCQPACWSSWALPSKKCGSCSVQVSLPESRLPAVSYHCTVPVWQQQTLTCWSTRISWLG